MLTVVEGAKTLTRAYDSLGRLSSYTDGDGNAIGYAYDDLGRLTQLTYPDGKHVNYAYDTAGRLSTVTDWASRVTTYSYDAMGLVTQTLRPNGTKQVRTYDDASQLTQLTEVAPDGTTVIYSGAHSYDAAGQLTGETINPGIVPAPVNVAQTFDADNRLLTHNGAATTFDADGNLLSIASGIAPASYTYDARNRLTAAGGLTYGYNAENRRTSVTDSTGTTSYVVNPNATLDQVLIRTSPSGAKTFYVYGLGLMHEETGSTVRYYHCDRRGDAIALTDGTGAVTDRASYGVSGEILSRTGTTNTPFLFNGCYGVQADANGIYYHRARYYHPFLRRFLNQDIMLGSIAENTGLNLFAYAGGNPVTGVDPLGLDWYNPATWSWKTIGSAFEYKAGVGPGVAANIRVSQIQVSAGARVTLLGGWGNLAGEKRSYQSIDADLFKLGFGQNTQVGLGYKYDAKWGYDQKGQYVYTEKSDLVLAWKQDQVKGKVSTDTTGWWKFGFGVNVLFVDLGVSVDIEKIVEGIVIEDPKCKL